MADTSDESKGTESPSAATPERNDAKPSEKASPTASNTTSHIVDDTEKWLGRSIIITGAPKPKR